MDKYEIWLLNNKLNNKVIGTKEKTGHYYVSDAIRDYKQEQVGNVPQANACAQLSDVRAWIEENKYSHGAFGLEVINVDCLLEYLSEHF
jgi:hypothetical protein